MVVEVTSPDTRGNDLGPKRVFYHRAGVPLYVIADVEENDQERHVKIIGLRHAPGKYEPIAPGLSRLALARAGSSLAGSDPGPARRFRSSRLLRPRNR